MASKRVFGFDLIKCIAMFLVVAIHYMFYVPLYSNTVLNNAFSVLTCLGVPLFFAVNGALLFSRPLNLEKHYRKTLRLIGVLLLWKVLSAFIMGPIIGKDPFSEGAAAFAEYILFGSLDGFQLGHFWFMYALIALYIVFPVLKICFDTAAGKKALVFLLLAILVLTAGVNLADTVFSMGTYYLDAPVVSLDNIQNIYLFGQYGYTLLYFVGGGILSFFSSKIDDKMGGKRLLILIGGFFISWIMLFGVQRFQALSIGIAFCVEDGYWNIFVILMTCSAFMILSRIKAKKAFLIKTTEQIGCNTMGIYFVHMFILFGFATIVAPSFTGGGVPFFLNILAMVLVFFLSFGVAFLGSKIPGVRVLFRL